VSCFAAQQQGAATGWKMTFFKLKGKKSANNSLCSFFLKIRTKLNRQGHNLPKSWSAVLDKVNAEPKADVITGSP